MAARWKKWLMCPDMGFALRGRYAEAAAGDVAGNRRQLLTAFAQLGFHNVEFFLGAAAHQHVNGADAFALEQFSDQVFTDKTGSASNKIIHELWFRERKVFEIVVLGFEMEFTFHA